MNHPLQPLELDKHNILRFKENKIVRYIIDNGNITLNDIAVKAFPREDHVQLAQLIGYSLDGFGTLSYVSDEDYEAAKIMYDDRLNEKDAKIKILETKLNNIRKLLKSGVSELYNIHPDDLGE